MSQALSAEVERRVFADGRTQLLPRLKEAIAEAQQQSPRAADTYNGLSGVVKNIMGQYGMNHAAKYGDETQLALSVLGAALNGFLSKGDVSASDIKTLLDALPSEDQAALQAADADAGGGHLTERERPGTYPLTELTCSPLTSRVHPRPFPVREVPGTLVTQRNFCTLQFSGPAGARVLRVAAWNAAGTRLWETEFPAARRGTPYRPSP